MTNLPFDTHDAEGFLSRLVPEWIEDLDPADRAAHEAEVARTGDVGLSFERDGDLWRVTWHGEPISPWLTEAAIMRRSLDLN